MTSEERPALSAGELEIIRQRTLMDLRFAATQDPEEGHMAADDALVHVVQALGWHDVAAAYGAIRKWYA